MAKMGFFDALTTLLVIVGALNWGLVGLMDMNLVHMLFAAMPMVEKAVYILVGLSGLYMIYVAFKAVK